jgi:hypothetical protein
MKARSALAGAIALVAIAAAAPSASAADEPDAPVTPDVTATMTAPAQVQYDGRRPGGCVTAEVTVAVAGAGLAAADSWEAWVTALPAGSDDSGDGSGDDEGDDDGTGDGPSDEVFIHGAAGDASGTGTLEFCGGDAAELELTGTVTLLSDDPDADLPIVDLEPATLSLVAAPVAPLTLRVSSARVASGTAFTASACTTAAGVPLRLQLTGNGAVSRVASETSTVEDGCLTIRFRQTLAKHARPEVFTVTAWSAATADFRAAPRTRAKVRVAR